MNERAMSDSSPVNCSHHLHSGLTRLSEQEDPLLSLTETPACYSTRVRPRFLILSLVCPFSWEIGLQFIEFCSPSEIIWSDRYLDPLRAVLSFIDACSAPYHDCVFQIPEPPGSARVRLDKFLPPQE